MRKTAIVLAVLLSALAAVPSAGARRKPAPSPTKSVATAQAQLRHLAPSSFAGRNRTQIKGLLSQSRGALAKRRVCPALFALDAAHSRLLQRATWRRGRVPSVVSRTIAPGLDRAERTVVSSAKSCAAPSFALSAPPSQRTGGVNLTPNPTLAIGNAQGQDEGPAIKAGPYRPITSLGRQTTPAPDPQFPAGAAPRASASDAGSLRVFGSGNLGVAPRSGGEPKEPTVAMSHNVAWYTGNTSAGYSLDGGTNWTTLNPSTILADPTQNSLCCDQQVIYAPAQNLFVWILQYRCPVSPAPTPPGGTTNDCNVVPGNDIIRFAVATPEEIRVQAQAGDVGKAWHIVVDLTPQQIQQPANAWFDYSTVSVNDSFLNWTVNIFRGRDAAVAMRINLASLAHHGFQSNYFFSLQHTVAAQEAPGTSNSYFAAALSLSQLRGYAWAAYSTLALIHDAFHASIPINNDSILGTDGVDWNARAGGLAGVSLSAAWSKDKLVVASMAGRDQCTAHCNPGETPALKRVYDHPAIFLDTLDTSKFDQGHLFTIFSQIYSSTLNYSWPSLGVAKSGAIGISFLQSFDNANPTPVAGFLGENPYQAGADGQYLSVFNEPGAGPQPGASDASGHFSGGTGDYYSLQPGPEYESFLMPIRSVDPNLVGGGTSDDWRFIAVGRGPALTASPPFVSIVAPQDGASFPQGQPITFRADVGDAEDGEIPAEAIAWSVDGQPTNFRGSLISESDLSIGTHEVSVTATDSGGLTTTKSIHVTIVQRSPTAPLVQITSPSDGSGFQTTGADGGGEYVDVPLQGQASDPGGKPLTISWTLVDDNTGSAQVFSHDLNPTVRLRDNSNHCGNRFWDISLQASNGSETSVDSIRLGVSSPDCVK